MLAEIFRHFLSFNREGCWIAVHYAMAISVHSAIHGSVISCCRLQYDMSLLVVPLSKFDIILRCGIVLHPAKP